MALTRRFGVPYLLALGNHDVASSDCYAPQYQPVVRGFNDVRRVVSRHLTATTAMWQAIKYVSSGFTLCSFMVAAVVVYLKHRELFNRSTKLFETFISGNRAGLARASLASIH